MDRALRNYTLQAQADLRDKHGTNASAICLRRRETLPQSLLIVADQWQGSRYQTEEQS